MRMPVQRARDRWRLGTLAAGVMLGLAGTVHATHVPDPGEYVYYDPDPTPGTPVSGEIGYGGPEDLYDWYRLSPTAGQRLRLTLTRLCGDIVPNLVLYQGVIDSQVSVPTVSLLGEPIAATENDAATAVVLTYTAAASAPLTLAVSTWDAEGGDCSPSAPNYQLLVEIDPCGNGVKDPGEECDDGNTAGGDCCSGACRLEPAGAACTSDGNVCTDDVCNGAGACTHAANTSSCDDGSAATAADTCAAGVCRGVPGSIKVTAPPAGKTATTVVIDLTDTSGSGRASCSVTGFADPSALTRAAAAGEIEVLKRVTRQFGKRQKRTKLVLKLNAQGRERLKQIGQLRVRTVINVTDRQGRAGILTQLLDFLKKKR